MYCVVKGTRIEIDSNQSKEIMLKNARNGSYKESEVEILTEEEYQARVDLEPKPIPQQSVEERVDELEMFILMQGGLV